MARRRTALDRAGKPTFYEARDAYLAEYNRLFDHLLGPLTWVLRFIADAFAPLASRTGGRRAGQQRGRMSG